MTRAATARIRSRSARNPGPLVKSLGDYFWHSTLPLTILLFLLPLMILYEVGTWYFASDWVQRTETRVLAFNLMRQFMGLFNLPGRYMPALAIFAVLLTWHIARRDAWNLRIGTAMLMIVESVLLALPLVVWSRLPGHYLPLLTAEPSWQGGVVLAMGAGVYEEAIFRLAAFILLDMLLIDLLRIARRPAYIVIVLGTSILFAAYHHWSPQSPPFLWSDFVFRTGSGIYFGILFLYRGFGVTAGSHVAYDVYYFLARAWVI